MLRYGGIAYSAYRELCLRQRVAGGCSAMRLICGISALLLPEQTTV